MSREIVVYCRCRVPHDNSGFSALESAQKLANYGKCPLKGWKFRTTIANSLGTLRADEEIALKLPFCKACTLPANINDFSYNIPNPDGSDEDLPSV